jgi:hypothetical protein
VADAPNLPTTTVDGDPGHTTGHDDTNRSVNLLRNNLDTHTGTTSAAHGGIVPPSAFDAKGDILAGTAADNYARQPAGDDGDLVTYDSSQTTGLASSSLSDMLIALGIGTGSTVFVQEEGVVIPTAYGVLNFRGSGVTATEDAVNNRINIDISTSTTTVVQKVVASDQNIASSSTLVDATGLSQAVNAGEVWEVSGLLAFRADVAVDFKLTLVGPAGSVQVTRAEGLNVTATSETSGSMHAALYGPTPTARAFTGLGTAAGNEVTVKIDGRLAVGGTSGNWKAQWAQQVSNATASVLLAGSFLTFARVS